MIFKSIYLIAVLELLSNNNNTSINKNYYNYFNYKNNYSSIKKTYKFSRCYEEQAFIFKPLFQNYK